MILEALNRTHPDDPEESSDDEMFGEYPYDIPLDFNDIVGMRIIEEDTLYGDEI